MHRIRGFWSEFLHFQNKQQQKKKMSTVSLMTRLLSFNYNVRQGTCICFILKQISGKKGLGVFVESP